METEMPQLIPLSVHNKIVNHYTRTQYETLTQNALLEEETAALHNRIAELEAEVADYVSGRKLSGLVQDHSTPGPVVPSDPLDG